MSALFMEPVFSHTVWGGSHLSAEYGYSEPGDDVGECWGIAALPEGDVRVRGGEYAGRNLSQLYTDEPSLFYGGAQADNRPDRFPLLIKLIDARDDLSIQVHPDDAYAAVHESGSLGKTECWYITDCDEGASLVVGHNAMTRQELYDMIDSGRFKELIREVPVSAGDFIFIPPGTVHAIKGGIRLLETQQSSNITYRVYDYDRRWNGQPRKLHIEQSKEVITVPAQPVEQSIVHELPDDGRSDARELVSCDYFTVRRLRLHEGMPIRLTVGDVFVLVTVIEGEGQIASDHVRKGDHILLPAGSGEVVCSGSVTAISSSPIEIAVRE